MSPAPLRFLLLLVTGWAHRHQADVIAYLQMARNLVDVCDGFLKDHRYVILDRDPLYTAQFRAVLEVGGVRAIRLPTRSPNLNAFAERFVLTIKSECLRHMVPLGVRHLRWAIGEFLEHYHRERNHQGLGNELIERDVEPINDNARVECGERLGGLLKHYRRAA